MLSWLKSLSGKLVPALQTPVPPQSHRRRQHSFKAVCRSVSFAVDRARDQQSPAVSVRASAVSASAATTSPALVHCYEIQHARMRRAAIKAFEDMFLAGMLNLRAVAQVAHVDRTRLDAGVIKQFLQASGLASTSTMPRAAYVTDFTDCKMMHARIFGSQKQNVG